MGPLPVSKDHRYLFTIIDWSTRWPEAVPIKTANTESCVEALLNHWVARFGIPDEITSDRGTPFTSNLWTDLCQQLGIEARRTTTYNPEANGMVERLHRTLKAALMTKCNTDNWVTNLPWVLLGLRTNAKRGDQHHRRRDDLRQQHTSAWRFLRLPREDLSTIYTPRSKIICTMPTDLQK